MVKAGETGGFLQRILERLVRMQEKRQALLRQLRSALTYPVVLTLLGVAVVTFIMMGVLPKFTAIFAGKEDILPWSTRFFIAASDSLRQRWPFYLLGIFGLSGGTLLWSKTRTGGAVIDRFLISGPVVSELANRIYTSEMLRTLGYLLESGVPLIEALQVTGPTVRNRYYRQFIDTIIDAVSQGGRLARPFGRNKYIPATVKQMVVVGEEAGQLPTVMRRLARHYDMEVETALKKFVAVIEPVALIFLGGMVGLIVSSIVLPLFRLSHALH
jgi:type II secretory pathway component PulF